MAESENNQQPEIPERRAKQMEAISEGAFREEEPPVYSLYIEFECFQDFNLGALLSMINTETEYQYIRACLDRYQNRYDSEAAKYFPALGITEEQIKEFRSDPDNHRLLHAASPMTEYFYQFPVLADKYKKHREQYEYQDPLKVYLYFGDIIPPYEIRRKWLTWAGDLFADCTVYYLVEDPSTYSAEFFKEASLLVVRDIQSFMHMDTVADPMITNGDYIDKDVRAPYMIDPSKVDPEEEDMNRIFEQTEAFLRVLCDFQFITRQIAGGVNNG